MDLCNGAAGTSLTRSEVRASSWLWRHPRRSVSVSALRSTASEATFDGVVCYFQISTLRRLSVTFARCRRTYDVHCRVGEVLPQNMTLCMPQCGRQTKIKWTKTDHHINARHQHCSDTQCHAHRCECVHSFAMSRRRFLAECRKRRHRDFTSPNPTQPMDGPNMGWVYPWVGLGYVW